MGWLRSLFGRPKTEPTPDKIALERMRQEARWSKWLETWPYPVRMLGSDMVGAAWQDEVATGMNEGFSPLILTVRSVDMGKLHGAHPHAELIDPNDILDAHVTQQIYEDWALRQPVDGFVSFYNASPEQVAASIEGHEAYVPGDPYSYCAEEFADAVETLAGPPEPDTVFVSPGLRVVESEPVPLIALTRIPTAEHWRLPLYVNFGGWNACPRPAEIAAFALRWHRLHGARIACITEDTLEFTVERPPESFEEARRLAMEHVLFCSEDFGDLSDYIAQLRSARRWFFWWG